MKWSENCSPETGKIDKENAGIVEEKAKILQKLYASINDYFAALYSGGVLTEEQASQSAGMQSILCDIDRIWATDEGNHGNRGKTE